jgi:hypothetical protein
MLNNIKRYLTLANMQIYTSKNLTVYDTFEEKMLSAKKA